VAIPQDPIRLRQVLDQIQIVDLSLHGQHTRLLDRIKEQKPPALRPWYARLWCSMRGHGGITNYPDTRTFFLKEGLCKRCGARVVCS
jgi:hypothetical protein